MNTDFPSHLAKQLAANPSLFGATKEAMLVELLTAYVNGTLTSDDAAEVEDLLKSNARAKTIYDNILAANRYLASDDGKAWLNSPIQGTSEKPNIVEQFGEAVEQVAIGIKRLLSEFRNESFVAAHLGDDVAAAETDVVRVISLADCPGLGQQLPWLGDTLRLYQQERSPDQSTAKYIAFVETLKVEPNQQNGELKVVLAANSGERSEVLLSFDFPACEFPVPLPADEHQLTLDCYADNVA